MTTLLVGFGVKMLSSLQEQMPDEPVLVIEHPDLIGRRRLRERCQSFPIITELIPCDFVHDDDPSTLISRLPASTPIDRILPATDETSTVGSARLAAKLGLPGAGVNAAEILGDKRRLREVTEAAGLPNPRWRVVADLAELEAAAEELDHHGLVVKPTGRSGSLGVVLLDPGEDLAQAWTHTTTAAGQSQMDRPAPTLYLVEERVHGDEVSVECLVNAGDVVFSNVTAKRVLPGRHPVEIGHVVPAPMERALAKELSTLMQGLATATGFETGVLHGEWLLTPAGPVLVECAGRIPGDRITDLIGLAYEAPFIARYAALLTAGAAGSTMPGAARQVSAITFLTSRTGTVRGITGVQAAAGAPGVRAAEVRVAVGDPVFAPRASKDRVGHVLAAGADAGQALDRTAHAASLIRIDVR
jgi:biotin carboxylase